MVSRYRTVPSAAPTSAPKLLKGRLLRGGNVHHTATVFAQRINPGALTALRARDAGPDFAKRYVARFGGLDSLTCNGCLPERTRSALERESSMPLIEALLEAIVAIERWVACTMRRLDVPQFSRVVQHGAEVELVWESHSAGISRAAARAAFAGLIELLPIGWFRDADHEHDFETLLGELGRRSRRRQWSPTTAVLVLAAKDRGIPHELLAGNYLRLGEGMMQQVVSDSALNSPTGKACGPRLTETAGESPEATESWQRYRLLVVDDDVVSALRCDPAEIVGDGTSSVRQLIERLNAAPHRNDIAHRKIVLDGRLQSALAERHVTADQVLPWGVRVRLPGSVTPERGATPVDVTGEVHETVREAATLAAAEHGGAIVGLEFMTADIARSCRHGGGRAIALNGLPDLFLHCLPTHSDANEAARAVLNAISPAAIEARIPTVLVVGDRGTHSIARKLDRLLRIGRQGVGLAAGNQITIQGQPVDPTSLGRRGGAEFLLGDPRVSLVVSAVSTRRIVERGLRLDRSSVTAFVDPMRGTDLDVYRAGIRVSHAATTDAVVIGADNPCIHAVLDSFAPERAFLVTARRQHPAARRHLALGGSVVRLTSGKDGIELQRGSDTIASIPISAPRGSKVSGRTLMRELYTAGLAFALGVIPQPAVHEAMVASAQRHTHLRLLGARTIS